MRGKIWFGLAVAVVAGFVWVGQTSAVSICSSEWVCAKGYRNELVELDVSRPNIQCLQNENDCVVEASWGRVGKQNNIWFAGNKGQTVHLNLPEGAKTIPVVSDRLYVKIPHADGGFVLGYYEVSDVAHLAILEGANSTTIGGSLNTKLELSITSEPKRVQYDASPLASSEPSLANIVWRTVYFSDNGGFVAGIVDEYVMWGKAAGRTRDGEWDYLVEVNLQSFNNTIVGGYDYGIVDQIEVSISDDGRYLASTNPVDNSLDLHDVFAWGDYGFDNQKLEVGAAITRYILTETVGLPTVMHPSVSSGGMSVLYNAKRADGRLDLLRLNMLGYSTPSAWVDKYLAMGDSFSSGEGVGYYRTGTDFYNGEGDKNLCHQSSRAYSNLLSETLATAGFRSVACSGAMMKDVLYRGSNEVDYYWVNGNPQAIGIDIGQKDDQNYNRIKSSYLPGYIDQIQFVDYMQPEIVTISIGGNDIGFGDIIEACVLNKRMLWSVGCNSFRNSREQTATEIEQKADDLVEVFSTIRSKMSSSNSRTLYVVGYPKIVNDTNAVCSTDILMTLDERKYANDITDYLNDTLRVAARKSGATYVDVTNAFVDGNKDYRLCGNADKKAVNGLGVTSKNANPAEIIRHESFHPNSFGHLLLTKEIRVQTNDFTIMSTTATTELEKPAEELRVNLVGDSIHTPNIEKKQFNYSKEIVPELLVKGAKLAFDKVSQGFDSMAQYVKQSAKLIARTVSVWFHSDPTFAGNLTISPDGTVSGNITVPEGLSPGYHQVHFVMPTDEGGEIDSYSWVYVAASVDDYDGDGVKNESDECVFLVGACSDGSVSMPPEQTTSSGVSQPIARSNNLVSVVMPRGEVVNVSQEETTTNQTQASVLKRRVTLADKATESNTTNAKIDPSDPFWNATLWIGGGILAVATLLVGLSLFARNRSR